MPAHSNIQTTAHAGHTCLQLATRHGTAIVALHGGHLVSWLPAGQREVFWLSGASRPAPAAIRGGVPICWPWFGKQGMPPGAMQHGPLRNRPWEVNAVHADSAERVSITLVPARASQADDPLLQFAPHLRVALQIDLGENLVQTLETHNHGPQAFRLTQALHSYFAVQDVTQVRFTGLAGLRFEDKLLGTTGTVQQGDFRLDTACDRIYQHTTPKPSQHYTLHDELWQRRIHIRTQGSQSVVVWNPGAEQARSMVDVPDAAWQDFLCVEATNAGQDDVVMLAPGGQHRLTQTLAVESWQP
ncbi:MAG: D-hexose-6-phosphate mutarotase [Pseudomonadota bacterium]